jgi:phosphate-selective porin OprO and OprP
MFRRPIVRIYLMIRLVLRRLGLGAALVLMLPPLSASGQSLPHSALSAAQVTAGPQNGFAVQSPDGRHRLQFGLLVHSDGRFALDDETGGLVSTFGIRRFRPSLRGRIADRFEFNLSPEFAGGTLVVQDAYIDTRFSSAFRLRTGKAKSPFGHERSHSAGNLLFLERALPTALAPNRDVGIQILGDIAGGTVSYLAGVLNGTGDGASLDVDTSDSKEVAGRVVLRPFRTAASPIAGLGMAMSGSRGSQSGTAPLPAYRTAVFQQTFFSYSGATADGTRTRYSPYVFYYYKGIGAFGEYIHNELPVSKGGVRATIGHAAWQVAGSYVLTGETATEGGVRPANDFDFGQGHWGALQIAARHHGLRVDRQAFDLDFAAAGSSRDARAWSLGANWYWNPYIKHVFYFERAVFDDDPSGPRPAENVFAFRTQLNF